MLFSLCFIFSTLVFQLSICIGLTNRYCQPIANSLTLYATCLQSSASTILISHINSTSNTSAIVFQFSFSKKLLHFLVAISFDTAFISTPGFWFAVRQDCKLQEYYSAIIFNVAFVTVRTNFNCCNAIKLQYTVRCSKSLIYDTTQLFTFVHTCQHFIADPATVEIVKCVSLLNKCAYNKAVWLNAG